jgi:hypothetical protein
MTRSVVTEPSGNVKLEIRLRFLEEFTDLKKKRGISVSKLEHKELALLSRFLL